MFRLFESIRLKDGIPQNLELHNERCNRTMRDLFAVKQPIDLAGVIDVPPEFSKGIVKCRIDYDDVVRSVRYELYNPRQIKTLQIIRIDNISYSYKYADRSALEALKLKTRADEILIVRNGLITDTSFSNVVFFDGSSWLTPAAPLLRGTMREKLLNDGLITCCDISPHDICFFKEARLINAMISIQESPAILISDISETKNPGIYPG